MNIEQAVARVERAAATIRDGHMVVMIDDEGRENEGDLVFAGGDVSAEKINFLAKEARGLICLALDGTIVDRLQLPMMDDHNKSRSSTPFTVSIEAKQGVTTGISAADRAQTVRVAIAPETTPADIVVPGHIFPLRAKPGGVLERAGHTEGSVDLARLAGKAPAAVICEMMNDDGTMSRRPDLERFAAKFELPVVSVEDIIIFRLQRETLVTPLRSRPFATPRGVFQGHWFESRLDGQVHFALTKGERYGEELVDVRVQRQNPLSDVFGQGQAGDPIGHGLAMLAEEEAAVFVYLQAGSGQPFREDDQVKDSRSIGIGAQILRALDVRRMRLHHRTPSLNLKGLQGFGLTVVEQRFIAAAGESPSEERVNRCPM